MLVVLLCNRQSALISGNSLHGKSGLYTQAAAMCRKEIIVAHVKVSQVAHQTKSWGPKPQD